VVLALRPQGVLVPLRPVPRTPRVQALQRVAVRVAEAEAAEALPLRVRDAGMR